MKAGQQQSDLYSSSAFLSMENAQTIYLSSPSSASCQLESCQGSSTRQHSQRSSVSSTLYLSRNAVILRVCHLVWVSSMPSVKVNCSTFLGFSMLLMGLLYMRSLIYSKLRVEKQCASSWFSSSASTPLKKQLIVVSMLQLQQYFIHSCMQSRYFSAGSTILSFLWATFRITSRMQAYARRRPLSLTFSTHCFRGSTPQSTISNTGPLISTFSLYTSRKEDTKSFSSLLLVLLLKILQSQTYMSVSGLLASSQRDTIQASQMTLREVRQGCSTWDTRQFSTCSFRIVNMDSICRKEQLSQKRSIYSSCSARRLWFSSLCSVDTWLLNSLMFSAQYENINRYYY